MTGRASLDSVCFQRAPVFPGANAHGAREPPGRLLPEVDHEPEPRPESVEPTPGLERLVAFEVARPPVALVESLPEALRSTSTRSGPVDEQRLGGREVVLGGRRGRRGPVEDRVRHRVPRVGWVLAWRRVRRYQRIPESVVVVDEHRVEGAVLAEVVGRLGPDRLHLGDEVREPGVFEPFGVVERPRLVVGGPVRELADEPEVAAAALDSQQSPSVGRERGVEVPEVAPRLEADPLGGRGREPLGFGLDGLARRALGEEVRVVAEFARLDAVGTGTAVRSATRSRTCGSARQPSAKWRSPTLRTGSRPSRSVAA